MNEDKKIDKIVFRKKSKQRLTDEEIAEVASKISKKLIQRIELKRK
ncbi:MAG: hypothetical protein ABH821_01505 [archaeon]